MTRHRRSPLALVVPLALVIAACHHARPGSVGISAVCTHADVRHLTRPVSEYLADTKNGRTRFVNDVKEIAFEDEKGERDVRRKAKGSAPMQVSADIVPASYAPCVRIADGDDARGVVVARLRNRSDTIDEDSLELPSKKSAHTSKNYTYWVAEGSRSYFVTPTGNDSLRVQTVAWGWGPCHQRQNDPENAPPTRAARFEADDADCPDWSRRTAPAPPGGNGGASAGSGPNVGEASLATAPPTRRRAIVGAWIWCADGCCIAGQ